MTNPMNIKELFALQYSDIVENAVFWQCLENLDYEQRSWGGLCTETVKLDDMSGYIQKHQNGDTVWYDIVTWCHDRFIADRNMTLSRQFQNYSVPTPEKKRKIRFLEKIFGD